MNYAEVMPDVFVREGVKISKAFKDVDNKGYLYLCYVWDKEIKRERLKVGTSCDVLRRMREHQRDFGGQVRLFWVSPTFSKYTTLRVESNFKDFTRNHLEWDYKRNDRFLVPEGVEVVEVVVRKTYVINL